MAENDKLRDYLKRVTVDLRKARRRLLEVESKSCEPIAIVGMSCRYPGGVSSPEGLWELVASGVDGISPFPSDRGWDLEGLYDPDPDHLGTSYTREGGFVDEADRFDARFFGISPRESMAMDPQQRLLLEGAWEAFEDAGIDPASLKGSQTGVFAGVTSSLYGTAGSANGSVEGYLLTGTTSSVASGRLAFTYGLEGPAVSVDTACSSSLVALHLAGQALRSGECSLALAGGVTVMATPGVFVEFSRQRALSPDGRCKSFSDDADGTGWSEGVGMLLLECLSDAVRNGHEVLGLVRGSAVNQDGASNGLTAPNGPSQQRVIVRALANARLSPGEVDVVEGHGTGTMLGDPIEAQALLATYGRGRSRGRPLWLGSVKSNIGHAQAAAGVAGVIKMVMAMRHGVLPRTLHVDEPSSKVDWSAGEVSLLTEELLWESSDGEPRRAGVSSFGVSGTNAHIILEEAPVVGAPSMVEGVPVLGEESVVGGVLGVGGFGGAGVVVGDRDVGDPVVGVVGGGVLPLLLSGKGEGALCAQAERLREGLVGEPGLGMMDVGFSLVSRSVFEHRAVVLGGEREGLLGGLGALAVGGESSSSSSSSVASVAAVAAVGGLVRGVVAGVGGGGVVFLFPGQGSQWGGMALELLDCSSVFAEGVSACDEALSEFVDWSLEDVLRGVDGAPGLDRVDVVQPVLFAVMVSLAGLWRACGVRPVMVVGHSQGEIAAAHVAGGLSLQDAARVVALRSRALVSLAGKGGMVSVALPVGELEGRLERWDGRIGVAAVNGPSSVVVSGGRGALEEFLGECEVEGVRAREIPVDYAAHSVEVQEIREELLEGCAGIVPRRGDVPFFSTVTGGLLDTSELDGEYWYRNLRETVRFEQATRALLEDGYRTFIEVSPHPVLTMSVQDSVEEALEDPSGVTVVGSLRREQGGPERFLSSLSELWVRGVEVDWGALFEGSGARRVGLPTYAFQRERYWLDGSSSSLGAGNMVSAGQFSADHPLLGAMVGLADGERWLFTGRISVQSHPWLADHAVLGRVLLAGTTFLELALCAGERVGCASVQELTLEAPLLFSGETAVVLQVSVGEPDESGRRSLDIHSRPQERDPDVDGSFTGESWTRHASGALGPAGTVLNGHATTLQERAGSLTDSAWPPRDAAVIDLDGLYDALAERGFEYGPAFQGLQAAWRQGDNLFAEVALSPETQEQAKSFGIHPALLDSAFHAGLSSLLSGSGEDGEHHQERDGGVRLPFAFNGVELYATGASSLRVSLCTIGNDAISLLVADETGGLVASIDTLTAREISTAQLGAATHNTHHDSLFTINWNTLTTPTQEPPTEGLALLGGEDSSLVRSLNETGVPIEVYTDLQVLGVALEGDSIAIPKVVLFDCGLQIDGADGRGTATTVAAGHGDGELALVHRNTQRVLSLVQSWLSDERFSGSRLVLLTRGAVAVGVGDDGVPGLAQSPVWGLMRSAQSENPERFLLIDIDGDKASWEALAGTLASGEPQLAIRQGSVLAPRLLRANSSGVLASPEGGDVPVLAPGDTVLITGGTGTLGALLARHLVSVHGVGHLLLVSRRGEDAEGAGELRAELESLGAQVRIAACDVSERDQLEALLGSIAVEHPLSAVVHTAGVLDDGMIGSLTTERLDRVLITKADAAWHLHELTQHMDLSMFVLFSSAAAAFGSPGQGNYAAANAFLDALAAHRHALGLPGSSLAWGLWEQASGMTGDLSEGDISRMARSGLRALASEEGLQLFDGALGAGEALILPVPLDMRALRAQARMGVLPALFSELVRVPAGRSSEQGASLARRLAITPEPERESVVLDLVRAQVAMVLGYASTEAIDTQRTFKEIGFDSLTAVELCNRLSTVTGLRLPATLVFDYPTASAVASHLLGELSGSQPSVVKPFASTGALDEPLAIVGMSCRYPGGVRSPRELWELVASGVDGISSFPSDRGWDLGRLYDPDPTHLGTSYARDGGFIYDAAEFDAEFFGISPREALAMDPQQRLLLEGAWEAFEDAGIDPVSLKGSQTGVFVGLMYHDYGMGLAGGAIPKGLEGYVGTGGSGSVASGRLSYTFGLEGPAVSVDTACSSSLVALHLAGQALRSGECSLALAGGVTVMATPGVFVEFSRQRALSPDGRCKPFADGADGTGFSDGMGMLLLECLSDAVRNGHEVLGLVRGSAVNQDGASNGLTAPNGPSQQRVIVRALANARLSPGEVDVVEGHGTGTMLGDPIEAQALLATYGRGRSRGRPLWLGSVKSNIGHAQAAAGVAGVIKMVMAMRHGVLPRTLHVDEPSSKVDWSAGEVSLLTEELLWESSDGEPRRAGVSSFGVSGTNAHIILEEAPVVVGAPSMVEGVPVLGEESVVGGVLGVGGFGGAGVVVGDGDVGDPVVGVVGGGVLPLLLSGKGEGALCAQAERLREGLVGEPGLGMMDVGFSLVSRSVFEHRAVVLGGEREGLLGGLGALAVGGESSSSSSSSVASVAAVAAVGGLVRGVVAGVGGGGVVFLFPGQGSQWGGMALELLDCSSVFAEGVSACDEALSEFVDWSLEDVLRGVDGAPGLDRVDVVQPVLFAVMVSLAGLWRACGVRPVMVVGHSQGEIAAAHVAGGLSLQDAARVVALRSRALVSLAGKGGMVSVALPVGELEGRLERWDGRIGVAAVNGPSSVVVSGGRGALEEFLGECEVEGVRAREIPVDYAAHSVEVQEIREELLEGCAGIVPRRGDVPFFSTVTGGLLDTSELDGEYWYRNLRETVRFEQATRALLEDGYRTFIEVSPHPVLTMSVQDSVEEALEDPSGVTVVGSLRREQGGPERFLSSLSELWVRGVEVDWGALFEGSGARRVGLPTYAFQRERYWLDGSSSSLGAGNMVSAGQFSADHPLLGAMVGLADGERWLFTGRISVQSHPWLADHAVLGRVLLAGTTFLELALCAGERVGCASVQELTLEAPLLFSGETAVVLQVSVGEPDESGRRSLDIHSRPQERDPDVDGSFTGESWTRHASGALGPAGTVLNGHATTLQERAGSLTDSAWPPRDAAVIDLDGLYDALAERGFEYGPAFQGLQAAWRQGDNLFAEVALSPETQEQAKSFGIHPALLDSAFHAGLSSLLSGSGEDGEHHQERDGGIRLPFAFNGVELYATGASSLRVSLCTVGNDAISLLVADETGGLVASIDTLTAREISTAQLGAATHNTHHDSLFTINWNTLTTPTRDPTVPAPEGDAAAAEGLVVLGGEDSLPARSLGEAGTPVDVFEDLKALGEALDGYETVPEIVLFDCALDQAGVLGRTGVAGERATTATATATADGGGSDDLALVRLGAQRVLSLVQDWLSDERFSGSRLALLTSGAVAVGIGDGLEGLMFSPVWGLVRSAQSENPERFLLIDIDDDKDSWSALTTALASGEPQLSIRHGNILAPRFTRATGSGGVLEAPEGVSEWCLGAGQGGTLEDLSLVGAPWLAEPLGSGQVRVGVRAGGLNFRDVLIALGMYPGEASVGSEGAGVVLELGPGVEGLAVGDRVMGLFSGFGPVSITDQRVVVRMPEGWSFAQAASVPVAFLTAYYALMDLAAMRPGERVLVHAGTGGVGMAAVQLARHLGAEVFATASPGKWGVLRGLGFDEAHIASSRSLEFKERFLGATGGRGVDVVLDSLAGEFVDASLDLLGGDGCGRFIEMGKTDIRDPGDIAEDHPGVFYRAFDLIEAGPERIREMLGELLELFSAGALEPLPITAWDVRRAPEAFRFMSQARHTGKIVLSLPGAIDPEGTVLITGGTGVLGGLVARHLVVEHGVSELLLVGRRGEGAEGVGELRAELESLGARVRVEACDVSVRDELEGLLGSIAVEHPLCGVVHAAGVLDDGVIGSLTAERLDGVLAPKVDAAWHLHELTEHLDLPMFVLFSSAAGVFGSPGQGNYAAANAFLDALASYRRARGLSGVSLAWGLWEQASGMTGGLSEGDVARMARSGMHVLSSEEGLRLFDGALNTSEALMLPIPLDLPALRARARMGALPTLFGDLIRTPTRRPVSERDGSLARRLAITPEEERENVVLGLVRAQVATVLGHASPETIDTQRTFKELGFDSLTAVELRNRLNTATGLHLPATLIFDYPTTTAVTTHILREVSGAQSSVLVRSAASTGALDEPLAIIGMSCRYPGEVHSPQQLWRLVSSGTDAIGGFPADRGWDLEGLYDPDPDRPGTSYTREGGFVYDADEFDAGFFAISPREALAMDPQQRLLLESSWEAFEDAGIDPPSLKGTPTGVFAGIISSGYGLGSSSSEGLEGYQVTGVTSSVASGRIAYTFGLEGPAVSVDTACSSSLVALHLAGQALRSGECSLALAGGVTVLSKPAGFIEFARQRVLSADGRCKSFAATADGTGFSEGVGMLLLERLSDAQRNGHEVLGLVRGSAVNQDGASNGLTAPNGPSQQRVIAQALANANLSPGQVDAVEAHGTGTTLGDPIEAQALIATYGQGRPENRPLWLGSIKSNIGHTQAAAGVAGVIKMVMAMRQSMLPRTLHVDEPSRNVDWSAGEVSILTRERPWERNGEPRRAGVSSFGISGTNAHVILEEAPAAAVEPPSRNEGSNGAAITVESDASVAFTGAALRAGALPWVLSGKSEGALRAQAERLREFMDGEPELGMMDVGYSLSSRPVFEHRAVLLDREREGLLGGLSALAAGELAMGGESTAGMARGVVAGAGSAGAVFLFPGQGSQWEGMALELLDCSPVFVQQMRACGEALSEHVDWSLEDVLRGAQGAPGLDQIDVLQPVLFAIVVSLAALWRSLGVRPAAVAGHSQGEIAAAHVAGGLSLEDAARVVALRSRALLGLVGRGAIASVALDLDALRPRLERWGDRITVSAVNGPSSVGVAGDLEALEELLEELRADGVRARAVAATVATHSPQAEALREELLEVLAPIAPRSGDVPFFSTVTGGPLDTSELNGEYWYRNLRETVQFERVTRALLEDGKRAFIEISPHPVLTMGAQETVEEALEDPGDAVVVGSLRREQGGPKRLLASAAEVWTRGVNVAWPALFAGAAADRVGLPTYAFQRERYWLTPTPGSGDVTSIGLSSADHPLLGAAVSLADDRGWMFTGRLSLESHPWLRDHAIVGQALMPGTGFIELALAAGERVGAEVLEALTIERPLLLGQEGAVQLQLSVSEPDEQGRRSIGIYSRPENVLEDDPQAGTWVRHALGALGGSGDGLLGDGRDRLAEERFAGLADGVWPPQGAQELDADVLYDRLADAGYDYGPTLQGLRSAWQMGDVLYAEIAPASERPSDAGGFGVHPALLDSILHAAILDESDDGQVDELRTPSAFSDVRSLGHGESVLRVRIGRDGEDGALSLAAVDEDGAEVLSIQALEMRAIDRRRLQAAGAASHNALYELQWVQLQGASANGSAHRLVALGECADIHATGMEVERHADLQALEDALEAGSAPPDLVLMRADALAEHATAQGNEAAAGEIAESVHKLTQRTLALLQAWIASQPLAEAKLLLLTDNAVGVVSDDAPNLAQAALTGLMRSAQSEHPSRFGVVDCDGSEASMGALHGALMSDEPELALREGSLYAPRLARAKTEAQQSPAAPDPQGTVLITDGAGGFGTLMARHLATAHGARHVLLVSPGGSEVEGSEVEGAEELQAELRELGCDVRIAACDVSQRAQLEELLVSIPAEHPLSMVVHTAGVRDDGVIESLDGERLSRVMLPKVDAAVNLHELAERTELILFSSVAAAMGSPGQSSHAAANSFLDALACNRRARGLPGISLGWGAWDQVAGMGGELGASEHARFERQGMLPLSNEQGLELFDVARGLGCPVLLPVRLDTAALRARAKAGMLPAVLRGLIGASARRAPDARDSLASRLAKSPESEWDGIVTELVVGHVAGVLGHASPDAVELQRSFKEAGFDSLGAVELRNRLSQASGLKLPATLVFDHPTPAAIVEFLLAKVADDRGGRPVLDEEIDKLERMLVFTAGNGGERERISGRLRSLLTKLADGATDHDTVTVEMIESASADEIVELIQMDLSES